jgi:hypothetical protein
MQTLVPIRQCRKTQSYETKLRNLHEAAMRAIAAYNRAAAQTSIERLRKYNLPWEIKLHISDSLFPIPQPKGIPVPKQNFAPEPKDVLAAEALRLGVPLSEVRKRFGLNPDPHGPIPKRTTIKKDIFKITLEEILGDLK